MKEAKIREPVQSAIILYDQGKKRETIVLQTKLVSTRSAKGMFFIGISGDGISGDTILICRLPVDPSDSVW